MQEVEQTKPDFNVGAKQRAEEVLVVGTGVMVENFGIEIFSFLENFNQHVGDLGDGCGGNNGQGEDLIRLTNVCCEDCLGPRKIEVLYCLESPITSDHV